MKNRKNKVNPVLIESDWNLNDNSFMDIPEGVDSINRIRLEFKSVKAVKRPRLFQRY